MIEAILSVVLAIAATAGLMALTIWVLKACYPCNHYYERIDNYNDEKIILVCSHCGKIKKLRK